MSQGNGWPARELDWAERQRSEIEGHGRCTMKHAHLRFGKGFTVSIGNQRSQAAQMVIAGGESEGGTDNRHRGADQWLFVVSGTGRAIRCGRGRCS